MFNYLLIALFISLIINGLDILTSEGYLLFKVRTWLDKKLSYGSELGTRHHWIYNPLIACRVCMTSLWGTLVFFFLTLWYPNNLDIVMFVPTLMGSIPITAIIGGLIDG